MAETSHRMLELLWFCDWEGDLTSFNIDNSAIFSDEKKYNEAFRGIYSLRIREKKL